MILSLDLIYCLMMNDQQTNYCLPSHHCSYHKYISLLFPQNEHWFYCSGNLALWETFDVMFLIVLEIFIGCIRTKHISVVFLLAVYCLGVT